MRLAGTRSDNGLVFSRRSFTALVRSYGLGQELIAPHSPEQLEPMSGMT